MPIVKGAYVHGPVGGAFARRVPVAYFLPPCRGRLTACAGGDADAASLTNAVGEVGAPGCARAGANKRVTFQLSEFELRAARVAVCSSFGA